MAEKIKRTASAQGKASREKGKRFERDIANFFKQHGVSARRTAQFCGKTGQAGTWKASLASISNAKPSKS